MSGVPVFGIDVGGTFTDVVMRAPSGGLRTLKVLSTACWPGQATEVRADGFFDPARAGDPDGLWVGYEVEGEGGRRPVTSFARGVFGAPGWSGTGYTLISPEPSPLFAIRYLLGLRLDDALPPLELRLGTTRGTNALLTRTGAPTVLVTTRGLADLFVIREQDRPHLFQLDIRRPPPLFQRVVEVDARMTVGGEVLRDLDEAAVRAELLRALEGGCTAAAVCLLHGHPHRQHEARVAELARQLGFAQVSVGSEVAPLEKLLPRGETTVLDAYLTPVLRQHLRRVEEGLGPGGSTLQVMTSAGGLSSPGAFSGKDSLLSGPAGGVVGLGAVARLAARRQVIGLDMGGTSTDVSRFHDRGGADPGAASRLELELVSQKAGVRIYTPTVAVETVAAGGGSICDFDGVKLTVGPASAGADPGPACYGRGGPLTVTDLNLLLGRLVSSRFPFPVDAAAARRRLDELHARVRGAAGPGAVQGDPLLLADGLWRIACASMVHAIRAVSTARGDDPRRHALCPFGAAAGQHACALASALEMDEILAPATAGVLSAHGLTLAERRVQRFHGLPGTPLQAGEIPALLALLGSLGDQAAAELIEQQADPARLRRLAQVELRYAGMESTLPVAVTPVLGATPEQRATGLRQAYEEAHQAVYGYRHPGRSLELHAARVEVVEVADAAPPAGAAGPAAPPAVASPGGTAATLEQPLFHAGQWHPAAVVQRDALAPGAHLPGPAIVCEPTGTLVVDPGWQAEVVSEALIVLRRGGAGSAPPATPGSLPAVADPVDLELFANAFTAIAVQMGLVLGKTATSTNIRERLDYSCALFTAGGDLVVNAPHIPVHLGAMGETVRRIAEAFPRMDPGDAFVTNDPYRGGSHLPDITVVTPVHLGGEPAARASWRKADAFVASRAHHADVGGISPGSMPPFSRCLAEEGAVIPPFHLVAGGELREAELRALLASAPHPPRQIEENLADLRAQLAANQAGVTALQALCAVEGQERVLGYMEHLQQAARRKLLGALARLPPGRRQRTDHLDDGTPIQVSLTVGPAGATVDFTGSGPEHPGNLNANRSIVTACVLYVLRCLIDEEVPLNAGVLAPIDLVIPEGTLLSPRRHDDPRKTPAVVGGNVETSQRIVDVLLGALGLAAASQGTMNNLTFGDGTFGYYETLCGGAGATPGGPGCPAVHTHMTNTRLTDPEVLERRYPVRLWHFGLRPGSGGAGRHPGGDGARRELELLAPVTVSLLGERRGSYLPFGLEGGGPGARGRNLLLRAGAAAPVELGGKVQLELGPGDRLIIETPGGGGWGTPRR